MFPRNINYRSQLSSEIVKKLPEETYALVKMEQQASTFQTREG